MEKIIITGKDITLESLVQVSRHHAAIELSSAAIEEIKASRKVVDDFVEKEETIYGITTGFGKFSDVVISEKDTAKLQENLIITHAVGVGKDFKEEIARGVMLLRVNNLAKGFSGARLKTVDTLVQMLNKGVTPLIPEKGSLGASGDLAPLSHMVLVMIGRGYALYKGEKLTGAEAMAKAGIETITLSAKEGLALINGTQVMTAVGGIALYDAKQLMAVADISAALTMEGLRGIIDAFDDRLHQVRPHKGQINTAANIRKILKNSERITHQDELRVQDAYTLRCIPQIHGASKDSLEYIEKKVVIEMNSVTDNPIIFKDDLEVISGGNFHGQPMALIFDHLKIALAEIANATERRIERLVNPQLSGLPAFLTKKGGLNSGFMITQYSAASLVSENKVLAHPASVDSITSSANQEDHVSMGTIAARQAFEILENVQNVVSIELYAACQAIDLQEEMALGEGTQIAYNEIRNVIDFLEDDRELKYDMDASLELIKSEKLLKAVESKIGDLYKN